MNPLKQTLQTYIKTLHAKGASKDYELANEISFYNDWMLDEIEVIKPDTLE